ncbi:MAG: TatD family hydrolase [Candidatus Staskawiczbacteria bacterium]|nr:TatD family hydrolase [Candidatus Staskawiczbacteria bacterium]
MISKFVLFLKTAEGASRRNKLLLKNIFEISDGVVYDLYMKIIDTHSHLGFKAYDADRDEVIKRTQEEGLVCIDVGTNFKTSERVIELAEKNKNIYSAIGMHPIHIKTDLVKIKMDEEEGAFMPSGEEFDKEKYKKIALSSKKVVAIGEIGLDYYYRPKTKIRLEEFKKLQKELFIKQLDLAEELNLPVIIHCRMAFEDVYEILKDMNLKGVIHCFTGSWEVAQKFIDLGFYLGINGIIYKMDLTEVIKNAPLEKLLVETDCPYLTPTAEGKDKRNEPIFVKHVIQKIADLKGLTFDQVVEVTTANAKQLFKI